MGKTAGTTTVRIKKMKTYGEAAFNQVPSNEMNSESLIRELGERVIDPSASISLWGENSGSLEQNDMADCEQSTTINHVESSIEDSAVSVSANISLWDDSVSQLERNDLLDCEQSPDSMIEGSANNLFWINEHNVDSTKANQIKESSITESSVDPISPNLHRDEMMKNDESPMADEQCHVRLNENIDEIDNQINSVFHEQCDDLKEDCEDPPDSIVPELDNSDGFGEPTKEEMIGLIDESLTEMGQTILDYSIQEVVEKIEYNLGMDINNWRSLIKKRAKKFALQAYEAKTLEVATESEDVPNDVDEWNEMDESTDKNFELSEGESEDEVDHEPSAVESHPPTQPLSKSAKEEIQAMAEDKEIQQRNKEMVEMIQGQDSKKSDKMIERRNKLLERIRAKSGPSKELFYQKTELELKELTSSNTIKKPISPECVMQIQSHHHWGGGKKLSRDALKRSLKKQVVNKANEFFVKDNAPSKKISTEEYLKMLKVKECERRLARKREEVIKTPLSPLSGDEESSQIESNENLGQESPTTEGFEPNVTIRESANMIDEPYDELSSEIEADTREENVEKTELIIQTSKVDDETLQVDHAEKTELNIQTSKVDDETLQVDHAEKTELNIQTSKVDDETLQVDHAEKTELNIQTSKVDDEADEEETSIDDDDSENNVDRAAAYREMIEREQQASKLIRKVNKNSLVEVEAEEEEEDEQGLGDFGFKINSTAKEGESERVVANEDDFENIVDDLSDNEGDEEEGNLKRQQMLANEDIAEKEELKRRMREGFSGRGMGALRGRNNSNTLFALSKEQKKHGLKMNLEVVDELDEDAEKDNEEEDDNEERLIDDENEEMDMMIKERFGVTQYEDSSDSEDEEEDVEVISDEKKDTTEEEDELTDRRVAKQWEKRVKMRRVLANKDTSSATPYFGLLEDEDTDSQSMLSMLKRSANPLKRSNSTTQFNQDSNFGDIGMMRSASIPGADTRKGSFISMKRTTSLTTNKTVANNRFVFQQGAGMNEESQSSVSNAWTEHVKRNSADQQSKSISTTTEKSKDSKRAPDSLSTALWTSIAANKFKKLKK